MATNTAAARSPRKVISDYRRRKSDVEMTASDGRKVFVTASATIPEMLAEGVCDIGLSAFGAPKVPGWFYSDDTTP